MSHSRFSWFSKSWPLSGCLESSAEPPLSSRFARGGGFGKGMVLRRIVKVLRIVKGLLGRASFWCCWSCAKVELLEGKPQRIRSAHKGGYSRHGRSYLRTLDVCFQSWVSGSCRRLEDLASGSLLCPRCSCASGGAAIKADASRTQGLKRFTKFLPKATAVCCS
jgi:hypothetical protein